MLVQETAPASTSTTATSTTPTATQTTATQTTATTTATQTTATQTTQTGPASTHTSNIDTNGKPDQVGPQSTDAGSSKVAILSFRITPNKDDTFKDITLKYTGTNKGDIDAVYLYQESDKVPGTFDPEKDKARARTTTIDSSGEAVLHPSLAPLTADTRPSLQLSGGDQVQFYVVVDVSSSAPAGDTIDFRVAKDQITFDSGTWPLPSDASDWNPSDSTAISAKAPADTTPTTTTTQASTTPQSTTSKQPKPKSTPPTGTTQTETTPTGTTPTDTTPTSTTSKHGKSNNTTQTASSRPT